MVDSTPPEDEESTPSRPTVMLAAKIIRTVTKSAADDGRDLLLAMAYSSNIHDSVSAEEMTFIDVSHPGIYSRPQHLTENFVEFTGRTNIRRCAAHYHNFARIESIDDDFFMPDRNPSSTTLLTRTLQQGNEVRILNLAAFDQAFVLSPAARTAARSIPPVDGSADVDILNAMAFGEPTATDDAAAAAAAVAIDHASWLFAIAVAEAREPHSPPSGGARSACTDADGLSRDMAHGAAGAKPDPESRWWRARGWRMAQAENYSARVLLRPHAPSLPHRIDHLLLPYAPTREFRSGDGGRTCGSLCGAWKEWR